MSENKGHQASTKGINPLEGESVLKNVHPSLINWKKRFFFSVLFILIGLSAGGDFGAYLAFFGIFLGLSVFISRLVKRYIVTNQRVKVKTGLLGSKTKEARLDDISGISTKSGFIEGIFGKGTVSVTDVAREELSIKGVGDYEDLAQTLRKQARSASQPSHSASQQPPRSQRSTQEQQLGQDSQSTKNAQAAGDAQSADNAQQEQSTKDQQRDETDTKEDDHEACLSCEERIDDNAEFCPECGAKNPFTPSSGPASQNHEHERRTDLERRSFRSDRPSARTETTTPEDHPVISAADAVSSTERPGDDIAKELCRVLTDHSADERRVESVLRDAVGAIESREAVPEGLSQLGKSPTTNQLESVRGRIVRSDGETIKKLVPIVDHAIKIDNELNDVKGERDRYRDTLEKICRVSAQNDAVRFQSTDPIEQVSELASSIERGDLVIDSPGSSWEPVADEVERTHRPQASEARDLIDVLGSDDESEIASVLGSTVEALDELDELRSGVVDIEVDDIRRRIDSLESELQRSDGNVYRHLADRIRELEAMLEAEEVDDIQLYAIYQEVSFYDRTLLPRLSRSNSNTTDEDGEKMLETVQGRIEEIEAEFVSVRPDHNHSIPKHFLELAEELSTNAERELRSHPERAVGVLVASDAVLDHVEQLYERNEYSVMLRQLRG